MFVCVDFFLYITTLNANLLIINMYVTYLAIKIIVSVTGLTKRTVISFLAQFETGSAEWKTSYKLVNPAAVTTLAL